MAKLLLGSWVLAALVLPTDARFEKDGVRVGDAFVTGPALELREVEGGVFLASGNVLEPLSAGMAVEAAPGLTFTLEPGVRAALSDKGYRLSTHAGRALNVKAADKVIKMESPATLQVTEKGWLIGDQVIPAGSLIIGVQGQGDPDRDLGAMERTMNRRAQSRQTRGANVKERLVVFPDPRVPNKGATADALQSQQQVTPVGF